MDKKRNIYKLVCVIDNISSIVLETGSLRDIDDFILQNNVNSLNNFIPILNLNYIEDISELKFNILYKKDGEIKEKPILFKNQILDMRKTKTQKIIDKLKVEEDFRYSFYNKYINGYLKGIAAKYQNKSSYINPNNIDKITKTIDKLITRKIPYTKEELESLPPSERYEILTNKLTKTTTDYNKLRSMYIFAFEKQNEKILYIETKKSLSGNEFEELMMNDQNPDDRIRYNEYECEFEETINKVISKKHKIRKNPFENQINMFDNQ